MPMSWSTALGSMDNDLESMVARRVLENGGLMKVLGTQEDMRATREQEATRKAAIDEQAAWRADQTAQRREEMILRDKERRDISAANIEAKKEAERIRLVEREIREKERREDRQERDAARASERAEREREKREAKEAQRHQDDPQLPRGVTNWLLTLSGESGPGGQPMDLITARKRVRETWPQLVAAHPNLDLKEVSTALNMMFTQPNPETQVSYDNRKMVQVRTPKGDVVPVPENEVQAAVTAGGTVVSQ